MLSVKRNFFILNVTEIYGAKRNHFALKSTEMVR